MSLKTIFFTVNGVSRRIRLGRRSMNLQQFESERNHLRREALEFYNAQLPGNTRATLEDITSLSMFDGVCLQRRFLFQSHPDMKNLVIEEDEPAGATQG